MNSLKQQLGLKTEENEQDDSMERSVSRIAKMMSYSGDLARLMQLTRISKQDLNRQAILYALNSGRFRSRVLRDYQFGTFSLANSEKGESRKELIDIVKASQPTMPKGFMGRIGDAFRG